LYPTLAPGTYYLAASTFFAGQGGGYSLRVSCGGAQRLPGDIIQGDGLNLTDGVEVLGYLFLGSPSRLPCGNGSPRDPANLTLLDWNDDAIINLTDVVSLFMYLYLGGRPHFLGGGCIAIPGCPTGVCE
jgi:hypothetical protein